VIRRSSGLCHGRPGDAGGLCAKSGMAATRITTRIVLRAGPFNVINVPHQFDIRKRAG